MNWSCTLVADKISQIPDPSQKQRLEQAYDFLMQNNPSSYRRFVRMQANEHAAPYLYEVFTSPIYRGIECALWPCESVLEGQENRASSKLSFQHKVLSAVPDYNFNFDVLQYQFDCWLFKTITGGVNSSKAAGCSPNRSLENKTFSRTFWQHQHLYLLDAVRQCGFPSFFLTVSPYEWTFPFPSFMQELRERYGKDVTEIPALETIHIAHVLEQVARGYLTGASNNRWKSHIFGNAFSADQKNVQAYFYRFEVQQRGTLHLHMLVWMEDCHTRGPPARLRPLAERKRCLHGRRYPEIG